MAEGENRGGSGTRERRGSSSARWQRTSDNLTSTTCHMSHVRLLQPRARVSMCAHTSCSSSLTQHVFYYTAHLLERGAWLDLEVHKCALRPIWAGWHPRLQSSRPALLRPRPLAWCWQHELRQAHADCSDRGAAGCLLDLNQIDQTHFHTAQNALVQRCSAEAANGEAKQKGRAVLRPHRH